MRWGPPAAALAVFAIVLGFYARALLAQSGGAWIYPLDDAYIHMAMAKNLAGNFTYGVSPFEFTSSSSAPAWVMLLAGVFLITGPFILAPLLLNLLAAIALILLADLWLRQSQLPGPARLLVVLVLGASLPLAPMIAAGMEHVLHILLCLRLMMLASARLAEPERPGSLFSLAALCALLPLLRYESLFLIAAVVGLLLLRRCWLAAALALGAAGASVLIYALIAQSHGWPPLPFSIYLKSGLHEASIKGTLSAGNLAFTLTLGTAHRLLIALWPWSILAALGLGLIGLQWRAQRRDWTIPAAAALMVMPVAWLHAALVRADEAGRYDAYVVALLILGIAPIAWQQTRAWVVAKRGAYAALLAVALVVPAAALAARSAKLVSFSLPWAQSVQQTSLFAGQFAAAYQQGGKIVTMELGGLAWSGDFRIVDLLGLGSGEITKLIWSHRDDQKAVAQVAAGFDLAIVVDDWYATIYSAGPPPWVKIARISSANGVGGGIDLYAEDNARAEQARRALKEFAARNGFAGRIDYPP